MEYDCFCFLKISGLFCHPPKSRDWALKPSSSRDGAEGCAGWQLSLLDTKPSEDNSPTCAIITTEPKRNGCPTHESSKLLNLRHSSASRDDFASVRYALSCRFIDLWLRIRSDIWWSKCWHEKLLWSEVTSVSALTTMTQTQSEVQALAHQSVMTFVLIVWTAAQFMQQVINTRDRRLTFHSYGWKMALITVR